jgi:cyclic pyranopterin phosphate synthase
MLDVQGRTIDYLRISVTDRCNLRCIYCMPQESERPPVSRDCLSFKEISEVVRTAARLGVRRLRITGGEPLVRKDLHLLVESLSGIPGIEEISLTTNGLLLEKYAHQLAAAGLKRVNVSLDSLRADRYREITGGGDIRRVFRGLSGAKDAGLHPVKINMIPMRGVNDCEIEDFAALTMFTRHEVRFIELMPVGPLCLRAQRMFMPTEEIRNRISSLAPLQHVEAHKSGPARYYRFAESPGRIGFISPVSQHFCATCNRLRLTFDGRVKPCLFSGKDVDLRSSLRSGAPENELERLLKCAAAMKPERHRMHSEAGADHPNSMAAIGG